MFWFRNSLTRAGLVSLALVSSCTLAARGQDSTTEFPGKTRVVPAPVEPAPFAVNPVRRDPTYSFKFEKASELPARDRLLIANAESSITELARSAGLEYGGNDWSYREIACPSFTNHLFLRFSRDHG